jgi:hypothetical protein
MKSIAQSMIEQIYADADTMAKTLRQTVGDRNDRYVTLEQLDAILKSFEE